MSGWLDRDCPTSMFKRAIDIRYIFVVATFIFPFIAQAQCGGIMEPGFSFLTSSRGCAPFTVNIQTLYLSSVPGTQYFVDWGDGTPEQTYTQAGPTGVTIAHTYPNASINCGYDVVIDAANACNPRGSVVPVNTQVIVWTNDVISISPAVYRVCQGFATSVLFTDNSDWNCFPRATRENNEPRWIQWIYGTGPLASQIPGAQVNSVLPGGFPYLDPAPGKNPIYPVTAPGQVSLPVSVPATLPADIGKEFEVTLKNWNQCNAFDNVILDGNPFNPVNGDLINGDNPPQVTTARIVIVDSPVPNFVTRLGGAGGPLQSVFCIGDDIYFENQTPPIGGASFQYTWEFYDNNTGLGAPLSSSNAANPIFAYTTGGPKLIRLTVQDMNAAGNCEAIFDAIVTISPSLIARIGATDFLNNPITPAFCQNSGAPYTTFSVRLTDISTGSITSTTLWRWEFYDENNTLVRQEPTGGGYSIVTLGPFDMTYVNRGIHRARLYIRDNITACETVDEMVISIYEKPAPLFTATRVCQGQLTSFSESSTLVPINGESIVLREWDFNYDGVTFNKDPSFDNQTSFTRSMGAVGTYSVALRVTSDQNGCSAILSLPVAVDPIPTANFTPDVTSGCSILTVNFTNNSVTGQPDVIDQFIWEVDAGAGFVTMGLQRPTDPGFSNVFSHDFENVTSANKQFDVRLRVVTVNGCQQISSTVTITVFPGTQSGFISTNYSPFNSNCSPQWVSFNVDAQTQSLSPTDYRWRVSDAGGILSETSTGVAPSFSFNFVNTTQSLKDFFVTLITTLPTGCFGDSTRVIRISPIPQSDFAIDTLAFDCEKLKIQLTASQKGLSEYHWVIAENSTIVLNSTNTSDVLVYEFNRPAANATDLITSISLDTKNFANCNSPVTTKNITIPRQEDINVSFTVTPLSQTLPASSITVTNTTNTGPWTYLWDFGDGTTSTESGTTLQHTYTTYGNYTLSLKVTGNFCEEVQEETIVILAIPPVVDFDYDPAAGCAPLTVTFTNKTLYALPDTYKWEFGDGQATSNAINPTYTYFEPGKYSVSLSATNDTGETIKITKDLIIEVYPRPDAQFDVKPKTVYIPGGILYTSNRSFEATNFFWDFGDNTTDTSPEPQHIYKAEGDYTVSLVASNNYGCKDTAAVAGAVKVVKGGQVLIPNAFSPSLTGPGGSGDGKNDIFLPLIRGATEFEMFVFNRWGELLFESRDQEHGWDGYFNGRLCQQDVYVYKVSAVMVTGERIVRVGDINLIR